MPSSVRQGMDLLLSALRFRVTNLATSLTLSALIIAKHHLILIEISGQCYLVNTPCPGFAAFMHGCMVAAGVEATTHNRRRPRARTHPAASHRVNFRASHSETKTKAAAPATTPGMGMGRLHETTGDLRNSHL